MIMKKYSLPIVLIAFFFCSPNIHAQQKTKSKNAGTVTITETELRDKIMGGWAGQTIGVTLGGPYEFKYNGTFIQDYQPLVWKKEYLKENMLKNPSLYDDIYMDMTFVDVFDRLGLDAPVDSFASAFARADYRLWHANQAARYNILNGIHPPQSGHWENNPHADDIDFQIESDFAGLMSPGMPHTAAEICDKIGHIMNYGDGWYGGVFISTMYTLAFISKDIDQIINDALKAIPSKSEFYQCIADVIKWHKANPNDWHQTWFNIQKKWSSDIGCPSGVFNAFNIDAKVNAAYVVMGLLYGQGDFSKTLEIATRGGQDADCNPSSAGGILGAILGYKNIPAYWKEGLDDIEDIDFKFTTMSLNKVYRIGFEQARQVILRNGGKINNGVITIKAQKISPVRFEQSFPGMYPVVEQQFNQDNIEQTEFNFTGNGFVLKGDVRKKDETLPDYVFEAELSVDGKKIGVYNLPTAFKYRRQQLLWKYSLPQGDHTVSIKVLNPNNSYALRSVSYIVYSDKPTHKHISN